MVRLNSYLRFVMNMRVVAASGQGAQVEKYSIKVLFGHMWLAICIFIARIVIIVNAKVTYSQGTRTACTNLDWWSVCIMGHWLHGTLPPSFGFHYILVVVDYISKWVEAKATWLDDAKIAIEFLQTNIFFRYVVPKALISGQRLHFCNRAVVQVLNIMASGITRRPHIIR